LQIANNFKTNIQDPTNDNQIKFSFNITDPRIYYTWSKTRLIENIFTLTPALTLTA